MVSEPRSDYIKPWQVLSSYERYDPSERLQTHKFKEIFSKEQNTLEWAILLHCPVSSQMGNSSPSKGSTI